VERQLDFWLASKEKEKEECGQMSSSERSSQAKEDVLSSAPLPADTVEH
jgi:hypothetical protein